jgi:Tol biopolymer transport system component
MGEPSFGTPQSEDRLDSWKEIAAYLKRDVTTVQRWEKREEMPVHRHLHDRMGSVYASRAELDAWTRSRNLPSAQDISRLLHSDADAVALKALEADPYQRYQHAADMGSDLKLLERDTDSHSTARVATASAANPTVVPVRDKNKTLRVLLWAIPALVAALVLAYFLRPAMPPPTVTGTTQLTRDGEAKLRLMGEAAPPLLTDGLRIYFSEPFGITGRLVQVSTEGGDTVPIDLPFEFRGTENIDPARPELLVAGAPRSSDGTAGIWQVPIPAGQSRRLGNLMAVDATWSPDGTALYYSTGRDVFRANSDGSEPHKLFSVNGAAFWLRLSTDEKILRFSVYNTTGRSLWEAWTDGSHLRQLLVGWNPRANECCGNWTSDGKYFIFEANRDGIGNLWVMREKEDLWRRTSREPMQLTVGEMNSEAPLPSKDGTRVFFIGATRHSEVIRYDSKSGAFGPYLSGISGEGVSFSPGGRIAYVSYPEGVLWVSNTDGNDRHELTFSPTEVGLPRWSPDGRQIAFSSREPGKLWQISVISSTNDQPKQLTSGDTDYGDPSWSPDGNSLVFGEWASRIRGSHANALHILDLGTRQVRDVPDSAELYSPRWSPDGRYLLAISADFQKLVLYDFSQRKWEDLVTKPASYPNWSHDGKCVYFNNAYDRALPVYRICLSDRKLQHVVDLSAAGRLAEGRFGWWTGLAPDDSILATRDIGIEEIYALHTKFP